MIKRKKPATITKREYRVLIKMWINYCSNDKDDSDLRIEDLYNKYNVGELLNDLDKVLELTLDDDAARLVELMLINLETLAHEITKELNDEEYQKETAEFMFKSVKYYILKADVDLITKLIYKLKLQNTCNLLKKHLK